MLSMTDAAVDGAGEKAKDSVGRLCYSPTHSARSLRIGGADVVRGVCWFVDVVAALSDVRDGLCAVQDGL